MLIKIKSAVKIIRPLNFLISFFSIFVACLICSDSNILYCTLLTASFAGAVVGAAGNVINDILDIEIDRINRPKRVLPAGLLSKNEALVFYVILNLIALLLGSYLNYVSLIIIIVTLALVYLYSWRLKKIPLLGNLTVAAMTALAFVYGGVAVGNWQRSVIPAFFAFMVNFIREILKDIEDIEGDSRNNVVTFPAKYGIKPAVKIITGSTVLLILSTFIPFVLNYYKIEYFIIIMVFVNVMFVYFLNSLCKDQSKKNLGLLSSVLKANMILGLLAIYMGK
ncbi:MAG: geranylgeranylglycerol-phosphate geranylgeranyltransferase [Bacillota bacterium]